MIAKQQKRFYKKMFKIWLQTDFYKIASYTICFLFRNWIYKRRSKFLTRFSLTGILVRKRAMNLTKNKNKAKHTMAKLEATYFLDKLVWSPRWDMRPSRKENRQTSSTRESIKFSKPKSKPKQSTHRTKD